MRQEVAFTSPALRCRCRMPTALLLRRCRRGRISTVFLLPSRRRGRIQIAFYAATPQTRTKAHLLSAATPQTQASPNRLPQAPVAFAPFSQSCSSCLSAAVPMCPCALVPHRDRRDGAASDTAHRHVKWPVGPAVEIMARWGPTATVGSPFPCNQASRASSSSRACLRLRPIKVVALSSGSLLALSLYTPRCS